MKHLERLGNVCKVVMAGEVLAVSAASYKWRRAVWTVVISGDPEPYSLIVVDEAGVRVAERLKVGDFVVAEATLIPKGARCEIRVLLIQSNQESRLPVVPAKLGQSANHGEAEGPNGEGLPWEDAV